MEFHAYKTPRKLDRLPFHKSMQAYCILICFESKIIIKLYSNSPLAPEEFTNNPLFDNLLFLATISLIQSAHP